MRRVGLGGMAAALIVGLGAVVATTRGADNDGNAPAAKGLLSGLFHEKPKSHGKQPNKPVEAKPQPPPALESTAAQQERYKNAWFRRAEICGRLRMIADQTGNEALWNQANELEERANEIYRQQTSGLPLATLAAPWTGNRNNSSRGQQVAATTSPSSPPSSRGSVKAKSVMPARSLGGSMDQREQAILNGSNMGGE